MKTRARKSQGVGLEVGMAEGTPCRSSPYRRVSLEVLCPPVLPQGKTPASERFERREEKAHLLCQEQQPRKSDQEKKQGTARGKQVVGL